jgi:hypothetical protein
MTRRDFFFRTLAVGSLGAAVFHALSATGVVPGDGSPAWRHALFVVVDVAGAWALWLRPRWLLWPLALLTVQQFTSHGSRIVRWWQADRAVDWISIVLLAALSVAVVLLWQERRKQV